MKIRWVIKLIENVLEYFYSPLYSNNILSNRMQLTDLLTVLCDRVGAVLLGQLYQIIVSPWIKVATSVTAVELLLLTGGRWRNAEERILTIRKVNVLFFTIS